MSVSNKERFAKMIEWLVNEYQKDKLEEFYGNGTKVKIVSIDFLPTKKVCNIHGKVLLGESVDSLSLENELATLLMGKALAMTVYDYTGQISITIDA